MNSDGLTLLQNIAKDIDGAPSQRAAKGSKLDGRREAVYLLILTTPIHSASSGFSSSASSSPSKYKFACRAKKYLQIGPPCANSCT